MRDLSRYLERYAWADEDDDLAWTVSAVKVRSELDVVRIFGGEVVAEMKTFRQARVPEDEFGDWFYLRTLTAGDHVVAVENNGWSGSVPEIARCGLADGGDFFSVYWNVNGLYQVLQAHDGRVEACFNPMFIGKPAGTHDLLPAWLDQETEKLHGSPRIVPISVKIVGMGQRGDGKSEPTIGIEQIVGPLKRNMSRAGDYSFDSIRGLGNAVPLWVENNGDRLLELFLEPVGQDYWLKPGESVVVTSYGHWDDHPFETAHEPDRITVWCTSWFATVTDRAGQEVPGAHQRPDGVY